MDISKVTDIKLMKQLETLELQVHKCFPLIKGCITVVGGGNKTPKFSYKKNGKSCSMYLGFNKEPMARKYLDNHTKLNDIINQMTEINLEIMRRKKVPRVKKMAKNF